LGDAALSGRRDQPEYGEVDALVEVEGSQDNDARPWCFGARRLDAGHMQVEQDDVRPVPAEARDRFVLLGGLCLSLGMVLSEEMVMDKQFVT
jgi:hypothetical protein